MFCVQVLSMTRSGFETNIFEAKATIFFSFFEDLIAEKIHSTNTSNGV